MPTAANMTIKKNDGTTDIVYDVVLKAGPDGSPTRWQQNAGQPAAFPAGLRPRFEGTSQANGSKTTRQVRYKYTRPWAVLQADGTYLLKGKPLMDVVFHIPVDMPQSEIDEFASQGINALSNTQSRDGVKATYVAN